MSLRLGRRRGAHRPDTVTTLTEATIAAFDDHGMVARTIDAGPHEASDTMRRLQRIDLDHVADTLERDEIQRFHRDQERALTTLQTKAAAQAV